jgi:WD40 repeat protein
MPYFIKILLAKLAFFLYGLNPVGMRLGYGHRDKSLREYQIPLNLQIRRFLLAHNGLCIKLVQRLQGIPSRSARSILRLNLDGLRLLTEVHRHQNPSCTMVLKERDSRVISISIHPTAPLMLTGSFDGTTKLWYLSKDGLAPSCIWNFENLGNFANYVAVNYQAPIFAFSDGIAVELVEYSNVSQHGSIFNRKERLIGHTKPIISIEFHPKHPEIMATGSVDGTAGVWWINHDYTAARLRKLKHRDVVFCLAFHPQKLLLASGSRDSTVKLWEIAADFSYVKCVSKIQHPGWVTTLAFHPSADFIATGCSNRTVHFWDLSSDLSNPTCHTTLGGHIGTVTSVKFNHYAPIVTTSDYGGYVRYFLISPDARHAKLVGQYLHSSPVFCLFHLTEETLVIGCEKRIKFLE